MITAPDLARAYDLSVSSLWRGEGANDAFVVWLAAFRIVDPPIEPDAMPDAVSPLGAGGGGIRWYATPTAILGFATARPGVCYRVPLTADLPAPRRDVVPDLIVAGAESAATL